MKIYKYKCSECFHDYVTSDKQEECSVCGDEKIQLVNNLSAQDYMDFIHNELENANYHHEVELPEKLYNSIIEPGRIHTLSDKDKVELARIIAEEFDKNI